MSKREKDDEKAGKFFAIYPKDKAKHFIISKRRQQIKVLVLYCKHCKSATVVKHY